MLTNVFGNDDGCFANRHMNCWAHYGTGEASYPLCSNRFDRHNFRPCWLPVRNLEIVQFIFLFVK